MLLYKKKQTKKPIDVTSTITLDQGEPGSNSNEEAIHRPSEVQN